MSNSKKKSAKKKSAPVEATSAAVVDSDPVADIAMSEPQVSTPAPVEKEVAPPEKKPTGLGRARSSLITPEKVDPTKTYAFTRASQLKKKFPNQVMVTAGQIYAVGMNPAACVENGWATPVAKDVADRTRAVMRGEIPTEAEAVPVASE